MSPAGYGLASRVVAQDLRNRISGWRILVFGDWLPDGEFRT